MRARNFFFVAGLIVSPALALAAPASDENSPHNVLIYVADGLRSVMVNDQTAPNMAKLAREGVRLVNSHSLFPTLTMANASAIATAHALGDTGTFGNTIDVGFEVPSVGNTVTPFLENDAVLAEVDEHFAENYLGEPSLFELARAKGYSTASIGKVGPTLLFDHTERTGLQSIVIDDYRYAERRPPCTRSH
jgi:arylsulfatase A-like enzyme